MFENFICARICACMWAYMCKCRSKGNLGCHFLCCYPPYFIAWDSSSRTDWLAIKHRGSPVSISSTMGLQTWPPHTALLLFFFKTRSHHVTSNISSVFLIVFCLHSLFYSVVVFIFVVFLLFIFSAIITSLYFYSFCYSLLIFIYFFFTIGQYFFFSLVAVTFCRHASFFPYSLLSVYSKFYI